MISLKGKIGCVAKISVNNNTSEFSHCLHLEVCRPFWLCGYITVYFNTTGYTIPRIMKFEISKMVYVKMWYLFLKTEAACFVETFVSIYAFTCCVYVLLATRVQAHLYNIGLRILKFKKKRYLGATLKFQAPEGTEDPQTLVATVHNVVARATLCLGFMHPWYRRRYATPFCCLFVKFLRYPLGLQFTLLWELN